MAVRPFSRASPSRRPDDTLPPEPAMDDILYLFGGDRPWDSALWRASDDSVRGGVSQSFLDVDQDGRLARFHGLLDTRTLGGAGFASQHSVADLRWDLSRYHGIVVSVAGPEPADGKRYVVTLKDHAVPPPPPSPRAAEPASRTWQASFVAHGPGDVKLAWSDFAPTYRGSPCPDGPPLDRARIRQVGLMMRSFFGQQEGHFSLRLHAIAAWRSVDLCDESDDDDDDFVKPLPAPKASAKPPPSPWWSMLLCGLASPRAAVVE